MRYIDFHRILYTVKTLLVEIPKTEKGKNEVKLAYKSSYGLTTKSINFRGIECDINKNYNDDLPYEKINALINDDRPRLLLFHGEPGTGKTSLIKKLISDNIDQNIILLDPNIMSSIGDEALLKFFTDYRESIFVMEDCDKILKSRSEGNPIMSTLLNLTDGLVGDSLCIKFICTFNTSEKQIDEAILRKGRLSLKYCFKKLALEKVKAFIPDAKSEMTLAEIYQHDEDVEYGKKTEKKIGF